MNWRLFFLLWIASVIGIILVLPYGLAMIPASLSSKLPPLHVLVPLQVVQGAIFLGLLTLAGLFLAKEFFTFLLLLPFGALGLWVGSRMHLAITRAQLGRAIGAVLLLAGGSLLWRVFQ